MIALACVALAAVLGLPAFVFRQEYPDIGVRVSRRLVSLAARAAPPKRRERSQEEWTAELEAIHGRPTTATGLGYASSLVVGHWLRRLAACCDPVPATYIGTGVALSGATSSVAVAAVVGTLAGSITAAVGQPLFEFHLDEWFERRQLNDAAADTISTRAAASLLARLAILVRVFVAAWVLTVGAAVVSAVVTGNGLALTLLVGHVMSAVMMRGTDQWRRSVLSADG